jgi:hypothetical protein
MPDSDKPRNQQPLSAKLGLVGALILGIPGAMIIAPALFPQERGQFSVPQMLCAGVCGALGAAVGSVIGRLIEGPRK